MSKKILHKINYYFLEYQDTEKTMSEYTKNFGEDFSDEIQFQNKYKEEDDESVENEEDVKKNDFHELYKKIAMKTHPDLHGEKFIDEFKRANESYNSGKWFNLIILAGELDIDPPEFNKKIMTLLNNRFEVIEGEINNWKSSIVWQWGKATGDKKEKLRKIVRKHLGIDEEKFKQFLANKNS